MSELVAIMGDPNSHGNGQLLASNNTGKVFIGGIKVVYVGSSASPDDLCIPIGPPHCDPVSTGGSSKVTCEGIAIHRNNDSRVCGAVTVVTGNTKVFAG